MVVWRNQRGPHEAAAQSSARDYQRRPLAQSMRPRATVIAHEGKVARTNRVCEFAGEFADTEVGGPSNYELRQIIPTLHRGPQRAGGRCPPGVHIPKNLE